MAELAFNDMSNEDLDLLAQRDENHRNLIAEAVRLNQKSPVEYDLKRRRIAEQLGCRLASLDQHVREKARENFPGSRRSGRDQISPAASAAAPTAKGGKPDLMVHNSDLPAT